MRPTSTPAKQNVVPGSWRGPRSRLTLLQQMAKDAEKLEAQAERLMALKDQARGVTYRKIADAVGVTERQAQRWFAGDSDIDDENLEKLAAFLGTSADYIEYGTIRRANGATPDPFPDDRIDQLLQAVKRLEERLDEAQEDRQLASLQTIERAAAILQRLDDIEGLLQGQSRRRRPA